MVFTGIGILLSVSIVFPSIPLVGDCDAWIYKAANSVITTQGALLPLFERIEHVFRRLEVYVEVPPTARMIDAIVKVIVQVLHILAIVTKELKQSRTSKSMPGTDSLNRLIVY